MDKQAIFDQVVTHLLTQGQPARGPVPGQPHLGCLYRAPDGNKCAIGCLIPDDLYRPEMEGKNVYDLFSMFGALAHRLAVDADDMGFLDELQQLHDGNRVCYWPNVLRELADAHGIKFNPPV